MESEKQVFSSFEKIFAKLARRAFNVQELEQLRVESSRIVSAIRAISEKVALTKCKKLNEATSFGFTRVGEDMERFEAGLKEVRVAVEALVDRLNALEDRLQSDGR